MTRDDIARIAKEAGFQTDVCLSGADVWIDDGYYVKELTRFAALVAAAEREACAKICDETRYTGYVPAEDGEARAYYDAAAESCAEEIRARGET